MPIFAYFLIAAGASLVLNVFPPTAIFITIFLFGIYWPGAFCTLAVAAMAFESYQGLIPRKFLVVPLLWVGFGLAAHLDARFFARELNDEIAAQNAKSGTQFSTSVRTLTLIGGNRDDSLSASPFLRRYDIDWVFEDNGDGKGAAWSIVRKPPGGKMSDLDSSGRRISYNGIIEDEHFIRGVNERRQEMSRIPKDTTVELINTRRIDSRGLSGQVKQFRISSFGRTATVESGSAIGPGWFLFPIFGCFPDGSEWKCEGRWMSETRYSIGSGQPNGSAEDTIAQALHLKTSSVLERFPDAVACPNPLKVGFRAAMKPGC